MPLQDTDQYSSAVHQAHGTYLNVIKNQNQLG